MLGVDPITMGEISLRLATHEIAIVWMNTGEVGRERLRNIFLFDAIETGGAVRPLEMIADGIPSPDADAPRFERET
jgi:hypothetical protein